MIQWIYEAAKKNSNGLTFYVATMMPVLSKVKKKISKLTYGAGKKLYASF